MVDLAIPIRGPFDLGSAIEFLGGFTPAAGSAIADGEELAIGFRLDGTFEAVGACVHQDGGVLRGEAIGSDDRERIEGQLARILALDVDGSEYATIGERDPVVGELQRRYRWLRAVNFGSPYEAALWGVLSQRMPMTAAAKVKRRLAETHGDVVTIGGRAIPVAPHPETLAKLEAFGGLPAVKVERLVALGAAAQRGELDVDRLRFLGGTAAIAALERMPGIGAWTASHVWVRGVAPPDELPLMEPRVHRAVAHAYGLASEPSDADVVARAEAWRPFRTWVTILIVVHLARTGQWTADGDTRKRGKPRAKSSR